MTMPNRAHGKSVPIRDGNIKICPHCNHRYVYAELQHRGNRVIRVCPNCKEEVDDED